MSRVTHFEISADDPEKMVEFYKQVFGWEINKWEGPAEYWLVSTGDPDSPGIDGAIFNPGELFSGTVNTVEVENLDDALERIKQSGGEILTEKNVIPGVGYHTYCKDIEGAIFGIMQSDPQAGME